jgi:hypothetical protein
MIVGCSSNKTSSDTTAGSDTVKDANTNGGGASKLWIGHWERHEWQNDALLEIKSIKSDSIEFSLMASSSRHTGELEGMAIVSGNSAKFSSYDESDTCVIQFELLGDSLITIDQKKGFCFAGMGVAYDGQYKNSAKKNQNDETTESMISVGVLSTEKQDSIFKTLVGDSYTLFVNSTQLTSDDDDLDGFNATVHSSGVRGLFTIMENIVMLDSSNNIWAAVIDDNKVYYFTTNRDYKSKLPKTIDNWRQRFKDYPIIYK